MWDHSKSLGIKDPHKPLGGYLNLKSQKTLENERFEILPNSHISNNPPHWLEHCQLKPTQDMYACMQTLRSILEKQYCIWNSSLGLWTFHSQHYRAYRRPGGRDALNHSSLVYTETIILTQYYLQTHQFSRLCPLLAMEHHFGFISDSHFEAAHTYSLT